MRWAAFGGGREKGGSHTVYMVKVSWPYKMNFFRSQRLLQASKPRLLPRMWSTPLGSQSEAHGNTFVNVRFKCNTTNFPVETRLSTSKYLSVLWSLGWSLMGPRPLLLLSYAAVPSHPTFFLCQHWMLCNASGFRDIIIFLPTRLKEVTIIICSFILFHFLKHCPMHGIEKQPKFESEIQVERERKSGEIGTSIYYTCPGHTTILKATEVVKLLPLLFCWCQWWIWIMALVGTLLHVRNIGAACF